MTSASHDRSPTRRAEAEAYLALALGVLCLGSAAILFREAAQVPPLARAFWRLAFAATLLAPFAWASRRRQRDLASGDRRLLAASGVALALHFGLWVPSLDLTSVTSSVVLVTTSPLFVALLSPWLLGERLAGAAYAGVALCLAGALTIVASQPGGAPPVPAGACPLLACPAWGNLMALAAAAAAAVYFMIGRRLRATMGLAGYAFRVYGLAALLLFPVAYRLGGAPWGFGAADWRLLVAVAVFPQVLGHTSFNWALGRLPAAIVSLAVLGEPLVSGLLAWWRFDERPTRLLAVGAVAIAAGLVQVQRAQSRSRRPTPVLLEV